MSSKRRIRRKGCTGKIKHVSQKAAERVRRMVATRELRRTQTYKCQHCGYWHWGHVPKRKER